MITARSNTSFAQDTDRDCNELGWTIRKELRSLDPRKPEDRPRAMELIEHMGWEVLPFIARPSLLFSLLLNELARFARHDGTFLPVLTHAGDLCFRPDDAQRYQPRDAERDFDSLIERLIKVVYKDAKAIAANSRLSEDERQVLLAWAADFVAEHADAFPEQEWFPYYRGKLDILAGRAREAREAILQTVRANPNAFWAWENLAATFEDPDNRLACLCRALVCKNGNPDYLVNVHTELALSLFELRLYAQAKTELERSMEIRRRNGWGVPDAMLDILQTPEVTDADALPGNRALYAMHATKADALVFKPRETAAPRIGILTHVNMNKNLTCVALGIEERCIIHHAQLPAVTGYAIGDLVRLQTEARRHPVLGEVPHALSIESAEASCADAGFIRAFEGPIALNGKPFGFADNAFIPPPLLATLNPVDGDWVSGMAVKEKLKDKQGYGWKALTLEVKNDLPGSFRREGPPDPF